jgi:hypothetical protein
VSFGISSGTGTNIAAAPVEQTFSSASGFTLGAHATLAGDWITTAPSWNTSTDKLVVICDGTSANQLANFSATGWAAIAAPVRFPTWNVANVSGVCGNGSTAGWVFTVSKIETRAGGSAGPAQRIARLMGSDCGILSRNVRLLRWSPTPRYSSALSPIMLERNAGEQKWDLQAVGTFGQKAAKESGSLRWPCR